MSSSRVFGCVLLLFAAVGILVAAGALKNLVPGADADSPDSTYFEIGALGLALAIICGWAGVQALRKR